MPPTSSHFRYCNPKLQPPPSLFFPIKIQALAVFSPNVAAFLAAFQSLGERDSEASIGLYLGW